MADDSKSNGRSSLADRRNKLKTTFLTQANALLRKNIVYQSRNWCTNICLVSMPIVICILLFLLQKLINNLLDGPDFKCGCRDGVCGVQFSNSKQVAYCAIAHPTAWPAFQQVGEPQYRAVETPPTNYPGLPPPSCKDSPSECPVTFLYTGNNRKSADALASYLIGAGSTDITSLLSSSSSGDYLYALATLTPATATYPARTWQYEAAFSPSDGKHPLYYLSKNCSGTRNIGVEVGITASFNKSFYFTCLESLQLWRDNDSAINTELYNGYYKSDAYPTRQIHEISAAYDFGATTDTKFDANIFFNLTYENQTSFGPPPSAIRFAKAMNLASSAFVKFVTGGVKGLPLLFVKDYPKPATKLNLDFSSLLGPLFFMWILQLLLPVITNAVVYEKQQNLRTMMKMHGLGDKAYWSITYFYFFLISFTYILFFIVFGSAIGLQFFRLNNFGLQIIFYFVFVNSQIAFAFLLSTLFSDVKTVTVCGYLYVFGSGLLGAYLYQLFLEDPNFSRAGVVLMELIPAFSLFRGLYEFSQYAFEGNYLGTTGMQFSNLGDKENGIATATGILFAQWLIFLPLAYYLDQVLASGSGVRRHPLFFLQPWLLPAPKQHHHQSPAEEEEEGEGVREDVEREAALVDSLANGGEVNGGVYSIVCERLRKVYPARDGNPIKLAVKSMSVAVQRGECFGMLGPNGAGKTTSINMMIGFLRPSSGRALIEGLNILQDMDSIYSIMGVCPQHDLLWEQLTGREHLLFYGRLKNLKRAELQQAVDESLASVNLLSVGNKRVGQYSGGMKRRLSVAISLIGNPLVVYMDEPSTGLDPASRTNLWNVVRAAKQDRAIILTTHSMEEAEVLCDRLGIFVNGEFQCIGNPKELTARFGGTFVFTITTPVEHEALAVELVGGLAPNYKQLYSLAGTQKFELPIAEVDIADVFAAVEKAKTRLSITAWGITNTTLEDVFIKVAKPKVTQSKSFRSV